MMPSGDMIRVMTLITAVMEYGDIIFAGTSAKNLSNIDKLFFRGLSICMGYNDIGLLSRELLCRGCNIAQLAERRYSPLLLFMHEQLTD